MNFKAKKPELYKVSELVLNDSNPRFIRDDKFDKLVKSLREFPKMLEYKPIIINEDNVVLAGNMRLRAAKELKFDKVPVLMADNLSEAEQKELIIKDNVGFGEWDWDMLANEWDMQDLADWGLDSPLFNDAQKIEELHDNIDNVGLPEFEAKDTTLKLSVSFESEEDREEFVKIANLKIHKEGILNWSAWWPEKERDDLNSIKYE
jgi:hypothetical protein